MSATLRVYETAVLTNGANTSSTGNPNAPVCEVTLADGSTVFHKKITLAAGEKKVLWDYSDVLEFDYLRIVLPEAGFLHCAIKVDTPESDEDLNPSGDYPRWRQFDLSCASGMSFNTDTVLINPTLADDVGTTGGFPTVFDDADTVAGRIYALAAKNPGTADVVVEVWGVN